MLTHLYEANVNNARAGVSILVGYILQIAAAGNAGAVSSFNTTLTSLISRIITVNPTLQSLIGLQFSNPMRIIYSYSTQAPLRTSYAYPDVSTLINNIVTSWTFLSNAPITAYANGAYLKLFEYQFFNVSFSFKVVL